MPSYDSKMVTLFATLRRQNLDGNFGMWNFCIFRGRKKGNFLLLNRPRHMDIIESRIAFLRDKGRKHKELFTFKHHYITQVIEVLKLIYNFKAS